MAGLVYILASAPHGTLYAGITNNLIRRVSEHRQGVGSAFCRMYGVSRLVWFELHATIEEAIHREKRIQEVEPPLKGGVDRAH